MAEIKRRVIQKLFTPAKNSHKGQNGVLFVIGGSEKYHGAPLLAIKAASRIVDLVYFHSPAVLNHAVLVAIKRKSDCFIAVPGEEVFGAAEKCDCLLVGNGLELNGENKVLVNMLLKMFPQKKFVLDAGALHLVERKFLGPNVLVTPHPLEFKALFGAEASPLEAKRQAAKYGCVVLLKKIFCFVTDGKTLFQNKNGNQGMTKGGTGDVLAGLAAAFACKNSLLLSAQAAAFLNGFAADRLKKRKGIYYNADDLVEEIPFVLKQLKG
ncbi:MAG: NAD(P)H-hydrate dehydratase [Candidatus Norongarragalinales archaeon]